MFPLLLNRTAFYRRDDPVVKLARTLQQGGSVDEGAIDAAITAEANQSAYGQAVALAVTLLQQTSAWWQDDAHPLPDVIQ